ncbi:MAG: hypothetical protein ABSG67_12440 [Thermoguttaceae bacterium]|jgi:hypothetical protein
MIFGKHVLAAGQTATATFTIENLRRLEGGVVSGIWSLSFDPTVISVSCGGDESLTNQSHLIRGMSSSQTITLTVTGVSGGSTGIYASWDVLTDPTASPAYQFGISGSQSIGLSVVGAKITADPKILEVHKVGSYDLAQASLEVVGITPTAAGQVEGQLQASGGISLWADAAGTVPFSTESFDLYGQPLPAVYVEGISPGDAQLSWTVSVTGGASSTATVNFDVIKLDILKDDTTTITDATTDVVVGKKISLTAEIHGSDEMWVYFQWDIPGSTVKKYVQETKQTFKEDLTNVDYLSKDIDYYWINGGTSLDVRFSVLIAGIGISADAYFNVLRPTATLTATPTTDDPAIDASDAGRGFGLSLHFGSWRSNTSYGITWNASVSTTLNGAGQIAFTQLFNADDHITDSQGSKEKRTTNGNYVLDDPTPYGGTTVSVGSNATGNITGNDSPTSPLDNSLKTFSRNDAYDLYLMYKPTGGIWVTLSVLHWAWAGSATKNSQTGSWSLDSGSACYSIDTSIDSTLLPEWNDYGHNLKPMPDN